MTKISERISLCLMLPLFLSSSSTTTLAFTNQHPFGVSSNAAATRQQQHQHNTFALSAKKEQKRTNNQQNSNKFDMKELKRRIGETMNPYQDLLFSYNWKEQGERPEYVHIILFQPDTPDQGVHTIEFPRGSGNNYVLAFQSKAACDKFSTTLKEQNFNFHHTPSPKRFQLTNLEDFCNELGVFVQVVPNGMELIPPTKNVQSFGHNPHLQEEKSHLDYIYEMFDESESDEVGPITMEFDGAWE